MTDEDKHSALIAFYHGAKNSNFWQGKLKWGPDQEFLRKFIWPWLKTNALSHDSYTCERFPNTTPFPTKREMKRWNYIGALEVKKSKLDVECPLKCRLNADWIYC